jgi:hypothetical protein
MQDYLSSINHNRHHYHEEYLPIKKFSSYHVMFDIVEQVEVRVSQIR